MHAQCLVGRVHNFPFLALTFRLCCRLSGTANSFTQPRAAAAQKAVHEPKNADGQSKKQRVIIYHKINGLSRMRKTGSNNRARKSRGAPSGKKKEQRPRKTWSIARLNTLFNSEKSCGKVIVGGNQTGAERCSESMRVFVKRSKAGYSAERIGVGHGAVRKIALDCGAVFFFESGKR